MSFRSRLAQVNFPTKPVHLCIILVIVQNTFVGELTSVKPLRILAGRGLRTLPHRHLEEHHRLPLHPYHSVQYEGSYLRRIDLCITKLLLPLNSYFRECVTPQASPTPLSQKNVLAVVLRKSTLPEIRPLMHHTSNGKG